ncbi:MAG: translation initiation factor IF-2 [Amphiplicatus sp.]
MSDDVETKTDSGSKPGRKPLSLRRTETAAVKQSFSHGRTKTVVVETKRRRIGAPGGKDVEAKPLEKKSAPEPASKSAPSREPEDKRQGAVLRTLSEDEKQARAAALIQARKEEEARRKRDDAERVEREAREADELKKLEVDRQRIAEEEEKRARDSEARRRAEEEARLALEAEEEERRRRQGAKAEARGKGDRDREAAVKITAEADNPLAQLGGRLKTKRVPLDDDKEAARVKRKPTDDRRDAVKAKEKEEPRRRAGKLTVGNLMEDGDRQRSLASVKRAREREKLARQSRGAGQAIVREVIIPETITVQELAQRMSMRAVDLVKELMKQGQMVTANAVLDADTAQLIVEDLGHTPKRVSESDVEEGLFSQADAPEDLQPRPPVVTIMGHVDHGKTSLLDALRQTDVVAGEAGGITQHIGAYQVELDGGRKVTFLDTPGHAAFTAMRARGAKVTDIVIIIVAADDSIMPQTVEAINHAKAAGVPIIVAINKIDKPQANAQKVRTDLLQYEIQVESLGGDVQDVEVSALKKTNLDGLLEAILLQAELLDFKANPNRLAEGSVVEARRDKGRGSVATFLVQKGTLKRGDIVVVGSEWGRVRALTDERGQQIQAALPAMPVEILGLNGVPEPGDQFAVVENEARAREVADFRARKKREKASAKLAGSSLEQMMSQLRDAEIKELPIVIKGDVQGSVEAIVGSLEKMSTEEVRVRVLHTGVGGISESDVILAGASSAPVLGFNVRANKDAREAAERQGVEIRYYSVIYDLLDDIKGVLSGMLDPELRETFLGNAQILEVFNITKTGKVAGCRVTEGVVRRGAKVRLIRDDTVIHEGELSQLKRFKDDVQEVPVGQECGMSFANYEDLKAGDVIECFSVEKVTRTL